jgi:3-isopropylmalate dehydrogenase
MHFLPYICESRVAPRPPYTIGVFRGEGIGAEVIDAALLVLDAVQCAGFGPFDVRFGGAIGKEAERSGGSALPPEAVEFCAATFSSGGAVLHGPGGGRFVYELRKQFDLFCKISPTEPPEAVAAGPLRKETTRGVDVLFVRENVSGVYQGAWTESRSSEGRVAHHEFTYTESQVRRIVRVAVALAAQRRNRLAVVLKDGGIPTISRLWLDCAIDEASPVGVEVETINVDYAAYRVVSAPRSLDVVVTPNLLGDILVDLSGVLLGSRGLSYSGNFSPHGAAVYQTNHGAAYDLAGQGVANPAGQIFSLAMLLRESFGLDAAADLILAAVDDVWRQGWRTADLHEPGCTVVGTQEFAGLVAGVLARPLEQAMGS